MVNELENEIFNQVSPSSIIFTEWISKANSGKIFSDIHKEKLSKSCKKTIYVADIESKKIFETCVKDFAEKLGVYENSIQDRFKRYPDRLYRKKWILSKDFEEFKKLLKQLGI